MNPLVCPKWDGCHLWIQWDDTVAPYVVEARLRRDARSEWQEWKTLASDIEVSWAVLPTWNEGWEVQVRVSDAAGAVEEAKLVDFTQSRCRFEIVASRDLAIPADSHFHAIVDGHACSYGPQNDIALISREPAVVELVSLQAHGYAQLDYPEHFMLEEGDLRIRNLAPSRDDVRFLPDEAPVIGRRHRDVFTVAFGPPMSQ